MRILIADDEDVCRLELKSLLTRHGHEVVAVSDGTEAWDILQGDDPPRLVILDWLMDKMDGVKVCRKVREQPGLRDVYLILLTSHADKEHTVAGLEAGANDYVTKPFDPEELRARVNAGAQMVELHAQLSARVREMSALATSDALTGISNRRNLLARLEGECQRTKRYGNPLALMMLDVDRFKSLNDTFGHPAGDDVLRTLGKVLSQTARNTDIPGRYGGEEFAVILTNTDNATAMAAAERMRSTIEATDWPHRAITVSIGVASWGPRAKSASELISRADKALYFSKQQGRNRCTHFLDMSPPDGRKPAGRAAPACA